MSIKTFLTQFVKFYWMNLWFFFFLHRKCQQQWKYICYTPDWSREHRNLIDDHKRKILVFSSNFLGLRKPTLVLEISTKKLFFRKKCSILIEASKLSKFRSFYCKRKKIYQSKKLFSEKWHEKSLLRKVRRLAVVKAQTRKKEQKKKRVVNKVPLNSCTKNCAFI